ncbi:cysteine-rich receptor-like protein kinase 8 [Miscanthus floridulus]|uniref:cysteine-rich receptor-like protein kinase 8 n=1 Tax=Miscanthus floridulus TaxID=154761 RepID=UPI003458DE22
MGSRYYMAPEYIWQGVVSSPADIYSLGVIIIEIITGHKVNPLDNVSSCQDFVQLAVKKWRNRLEAAPSETDCKQIKRCLEIGLSCIKIQRNERPTIKQIMKMLHIWESIVDCYDRQEEMTPACLEELDFTEPPWDESESFHLRKYPAYEIDWDALLNN